MPGRERSLLRGRAQRLHHIYGLCLKSHWALPCPETRGAGVGAVELFEGGRRVFAEAVREAGSRSNREEWFHHVRLADGSDYVRWSGLFEFLVSADGHRIACHPLNGTSREAFRTYLLGQVLSFALLKQGIEPLHSTAVVVDGEAVAFLGDCGYGKSSLGAAFLQAGHPLLTDDLLVVKEVGGGFAAYPGPPRIKLFPQVAKRLLRERVSGSPMNDQTPKLVIVLNVKSHRREPVPLRAIYVLAPPQSARRDRIVIRVLSPRRAVLELIKNTFNTVIVDPARLKRQLDLAARLANRTPVKVLSFPRTLARLPEVRGAIQRDLVS